MRNDIDLRRAILICAISFTTFAFFPGCDENPSTSSSAPINAEPTTADASVARTSRRMKLDPVPFTAEIPPDWDVGPNALDTEIVLRGPTAPDDPKGYLARQGTLKFLEEISNERFTSMVEKFKSEKKKDTDVIVHDLGPITVVEMNYHALDATTQPSEKPEMLVQQTFHLFGPGSDGKRTSSVIRFGHDSLAAFEADRQTLTKIIESLQLDTSSTEADLSELNEQGTTSPTTQPALP